MTTRTMLGAAFLVLAMPFVTNAATVEELQAQIAALLARINALQQQLGGTNTGGSGTAPATPVPASAVQCPHVSRVLKIGATGADVTRLQQFLARDPSVYPEAQVTGYYGALTEKAVQRFQCKNKLVCDGTPDSTGYGVAGPRTAALMALQCAATGGGTTTGSNGSVGGFIRVTPVTGNPPLVVSIEATVNTTHSCASASYEVDYGDNTPKTLIAVPANSCTELRQALSHTYTVPGVYTVILRSGTQQTNATVTVGGSSNSNTVPPGTVDALSANTTSGGAPLSVSFRGTINASGSCNINTYILDFGDGQTAPLVPNGCTPSLFSATHIYTSAGTFTARLIRDAGNVQMGTITVTVSGSSSNNNQNSSYGSFFSVTPGVQGNVFTVLAAFEIPSACTAYQLNWGDSSAQVTQAQGTCSGGTVSKQFEHTYASAGTYTVTLRRGANLTESHSVGITISD